MRMREVPLRLWPSIPWSSAPRFHSSLSILQPTSKYYTHHITYSSLEVHGKRTQVLVSTQIYRIILVDRLHGHKLDPTKAFPAWDVLLKGAPGFLMMALTGALCCTENSATPRQGNAEDRADYASALEWTRRRDENIFKPFKMGDLGILLELESVL